MVKGVMGWFALKMQPAARHPATALQNKAWILLKTDFIFQALPKNGHERFIAVRNTIISIIVRL
jgi:hypothetical protein